MRGFRENLANEITKIEQNRMKENLEKQGTIEDYVRDGADLQNVTTITTSFQGFGKL